MSREIYPSTVMVSSNKKPETGKKVGIYGGSFNPIHLGHLETAMYLLNNGIDEIRFLLNPCSPFKRRNVMPDAYHRAKMIRDSIKRSEYSAYFDKWDIDTTEMKSSIYNHVCYTVNTLKEILYNDITNNERTEYFLIMGIDVFNDIKKFKNWNWFLDEKLIQFIILPRGGYTIDEQLKEEFKDLIFDIDFSKFTPIVMSSTEIRDAIQNGDDEAMEKMLPKGACSYIKSHALYEYPNDTTLTLEDIKDDNVVKAPTMKSEEIKMPTPDECKAMMKKCPYTLVGGIHHGCAIVFTKTTDGKRYNVYNFLTGDTVYDDWFVEVATPKVYDDEEKIKGTKFQYDYDKYSTAMFVPSDVMSYSIVKLVGNVKSHGGYLYESKNILAFNSRTGKLLFPDKCIEAQGNYSNPQYITDISQSGITGVVNIRTINGTSFEYNIIKKITKNKS